MPIRSELRHLYRGPAWRAIRERILARAENECERCGKPNRTFVYVSRDGSGKWWPFNGASRTLYRAIDGARVWIIRCVLTIAHLNHNPQDNRDENLQALCQHCHLKHDRHFHYANSRRTFAKRFGQLWLTTEIEEGVSA